MSAPTHYEQASIRERWVRLSGAGRAQAMGSAMGFASREADGGEAFFKALEHGIAVAEVYKRPALSAGDLPTDHTENTEGGAE